MKAAVLTKLNEPLELSEVGLTDLTYGQVQVRMLASGICGSQLQEIAGNKGNAGYLPHLMGHEGAGIVEAVGVGVTKVREGDKVVLHWRKGDGIESEPPRYKFNGREITSGRVTTFNEQSIVSENRVTKVDHDTPNELCALLGCGLSTALGTIESEAKLKGGESILIIGCGGLGLNLVIAAKLACASEIVVADVLAKKCDAAIALGATDRMFAGSPKLDTSTKKFDVVIDTSGKVPWMHTLAPSGRYIMIGHPIEGDSVSIPNASRMFEGEGKTIKATQGGGFRPSQDIPRYIRMWRSGYIKLDNLITHRISLNEINTGIDLVRNGQAGRVLIEMP